MVTVVPSISLLSVRIPASYACTSRTSFFFSSRRRHTRSDRDWSSDVCSSDLGSVRAYSLDGTGGIPAAHDAALFRHDSLEPHIQGGTVSFWRSRRAWYGCAAGVIVVLLLWRPGADRFRSRLEQSLGSALGHRVEIGNVSLQMLPRPGFNLSQLSVLDDPQFSLEPILRADEVSATLHPSSLWRWRMEIATLSFKDASLNLVRRADGRWNLEPILERAAHAPAAPTAKATAEERFRFPYIELTNGRVNLKLGPEKMPYALTDADLALWLESTEEWGLRLRGQPVRTDMRLSDMGILRANATWQRSNDLRKTPLRLTATYEGAQLGQFTKLVYGTDKGWRGTVNVSASVSGSAEDLQIQSEGSIDNFRRYDLGMAPLLRLSASCSGRFNSWPRQFSEILCSSPSGDGSLLLRGKVGLARPPTYDLNLNAAKYPAQRLVDVLRGMKKGLPEDLSATGSLGADLSFVADGTSVSAWSGSGRAEHVVLSSSALQTKGGDGTLMLGTVPFRTVSNVTGKASRVKKAASTASASLAPAGNSVEVGPVSMDLAEDEPAKFHAWFFRAGYNASFSGEASIQRLLQIARAAGVTAVHPAVEGDAKFDWQANGVWGGLDQGQNTGAVHLSRGRVEFPGLNAPIEIAAADVKLTPDTFQLQGLSATAGGMRWTGSLSRPRVCTGPASCAIQVDLRADEVSGEKLNLLLNPNIQKQPWYRILAGNPSKNGAALRALNVEGMVRADRFMVGDLAADAVTAQVKLGDGHLRLTDFRGTVLGGSHTGDWEADFTKEAPAYTLAGSIEKVSLSQLARPMHSNWISGTGRGSYEMTLSGWGEKDLHASARGTLALFARDGTLTRFGPSGALKFGKLEATFTTGESLVVVSEGKVENAQGIYDVSGVASFGHKVDLKFVRGEGQGFVVSGTLEEPKVGALDGLPQQAKSEVTPGLQRPKRVGAR